MRVIVLTQSASLAVSLSLMSGEWEVLVARDTDEAAELVGSADALIVDAGTTESGIAAARRISGAGIRIDTLVLGEVEAQDDAVDAVVQRPFTIHDLVQGIASLQGGPTAPVATSPPQRPRRRRPEGSGRGWTSRPPEPVDDAARLESAQTAPAPEPVEQPAPNVVPPVAPPELSRPQSRAIPAPQPVVAADDVVGVEAPTVPEEPDAPADEPEPPIHPDEAPEPPRVPPRLPPVRPARALLHRDEVTPEPTPEPERPSEPEPMPESEPMPEPEPTSTPVPARAVRARRRETPVTRPAPDAAGEGRTLGFLRRASRAGQPDVDPSLEARLEAGITASTLLEAMLEELPTLGMPAAVGRAVLDEVLDRFDPVSSSVWGVTGLDGSYRLLASDGLTATERRMVIAGDQQLLRQLASDTQALVVSPTDLARGLLAGIPGARAEALLAASLTVNGRAVGAIVLGAPSFSQADADRLYAVASEASLALGMAVQLGRLRRAVGSPDHRRDDE